ncbi:hypothetical protein CQ010_10510 [Arthrobacter sp. MYb211]|uniref:hypothetical protein n=1 Tax=unclassified Arthrobacter TaxID=235627 RepID=UPI000CFDAA55|nr:MULTISPECIES: hypothetical protein [unclassified Arthrobacter]PRA11001.1 hypothetical protein CQ015_11220 [Arthrobacter sp. MYb221]PRC07156.1 hypothetical protein CQ010_10510 [Arthrobacter sp. MYb211]
MLKFFGLTKDDADDGTLPIWQGANKKKRVIYFSVSLVLAIAVFFVTSWLLADVQPKDFTKYIPGMFATGLLLFSTVVSERSLLRAKEGPTRNEDEQ